MKRQMIIFDLDGTLYRTHETALPPLYALCEEYGIKLSKEDEALLLCTTTEAFLEKVAPDMPEEEKLKFQQEIKWREIEEVKKNGCLFDGAKEMLSKLKAEGFLLAVCGMGSKEYIDAVVDKCEIRHYFDVILSRIDGKTKGQVLKDFLVTQQLSTENCIMIGDSATDFAAAQENDMPFIGVSYGYGSDKIKDMAVMIDNVEKIGTEIYKTFIYSKIEKEVANLKKPIVLGVNGVDTSGKTVFAEALSIYLQHRGYQTQLMHMDDFHNPKEMRYKDTSPQGYINYAFDLNKLESIITEIKGNDVDKDFHVLDFDLDTYTKKLHIKTTRNTIIILEGVLLYRPPISNLIDYKIFLDISFDEVLNRANIRDVPKYGVEFLDKYKERYIPAQKLYLQKYNPKKLCDMVIDNNDYNKPFICVPE
ncbi:HAD hydrolase-like protein [Lutispora thermophila]|uniref:Phosphoglycolate phosphatase n=1 Tax=Lutispora thermophila DSM 19022 TaxID=1122184 RepID=A0A1M6CY86_9FIRM|nr:HAD hydrolase-like protein [Lutispora thermophila]SHI65982.1 phosphoglycolate phosphatase [Lutispora thermophila DSM 19022]